MLKRVFSLRFFIKVFWIAFLAFFLFTSFFFLAVRGNWFGWFGEIPGFEILENPKTELASILYSADGKELGKYYRKNRTKVGFEDISTEVVKALIATEDERFDDHSGIDMEATGRVIAAVATGRRAGGGSTITQQLAKNLFGMRKDSIYRGPAYNVKGLGMAVIKMKEWICAARLEKSYKKEEIITMYLNTVNFGIRAIGINEAAKTYFNKTASDLNVCEAAILVGTLKANTLYDPVENPDKSRQRRNVVMKQMVKNGYLDQHDYDSLKTQDLALNYRSQDYNSGLATYFRGKIKNEVAAICRDQGYDLFADGLKVYTTIDSRLQFHAEKAVQDHMEVLQAKFNSSWGSRDPWPKGYIEKVIRNEPFYKELVKQYGETSDSISVYLNRPRKRNMFTYQGIVDSLISPLEEFKYYKRFLQTGFLAVDPKTGEVKAWVGGINKKYFAYDHVMQGSRQVGSTFKPIVYATAVENGFSPCSEILDVPISIKLDDGKIWKPKVKATNETMTLQKCLAYSKNNCAAHLIDKLGPETVAEQAAKFGIPREKLDVNLSMALGTSSLNLMEMIPVYTTLANQGKLVAPHYVTRIVDQYGKVIYEKTPVPKRVMNPKNAYKMVSMLRAGVMYGTGRKLQTTYKLLDGYNQLGGKTGTTQNSKDGWFFCINQDIVTGCWVGVDDNNIGFRSTRSWYGGSMALPIVGEFLSSSYRDRRSGLRPSVFEIPEGLSTSEINQDITCQTDTTTADLLDLDFFDDLADEPL